MYLGQSVEESQEKIFEATNVNGKIILGNFKEPAANCKPDAIINNSLIDYKTLPNNLKK